MKKISNIVAVRSINPHCLRRAQRGMVLIIVLWFIAIITVLVATIASEIRLSAKAVFHTKQAVNHWADILTALRVAEMELLILHMPLPPNDEELRKAPTVRRDLGYRMNGQVLKTNYPLPENIEVRIYNHAGLINFQSLSSQQRREILQHLTIGDKDTLSANDLKKLDALEDVWQDWVDLDDLKRPNGAEKQDYEKFEPPYQARNALLESVDEIRLLKDYDEIFQEVDLNSAMSFYNGNIGVNPNFATREALMLIPGMTVEMANLFLTKRREKDIDAEQLSKLQQEFIEIKQWQKMQPWFNFAKAEIYTIAIRVIDKSAEENVKTSEDAEKTDVSAPSEEKERALKKTAFLFTVQYMNNNEKPKTLSVNPSGYLPDFTHEKLPIPKNKAALKSPTS